MTVYVESTNVESQFTGIVILDVTYVHFQNYPYLECRSLIHAAPFNLNTLEQKRTPPPLVLCSHIFHIDLTSLVKSKLCDNVH